MPTISFPPDIEKYVHQAVAEGKYRNEQEMVLDALRLLRDSGSRCQQLRGEVQEAFDSVDRGEGIEIESDEALAAFFDELEAEVRGEVASQEKNPG